MAAVPLPRGALFAALRLGDGDLGHRWAALRPEAGARFPGLKLKQVPDLHLTLVYLGHGWREADLPALREAIRLDLPGPLALPVAVARLGAKGRAVGLDLGGFPATAAAALVAVKQALAAAGLKRPEVQDAAFRPHATLAEVRGVPTRTQREALGAFAAWLPAALDLATLRIPLDPAQPVSLLLAGAARPPGPDYLAVAAFLAPGG